MGLPGSAPTSASAVAGFAERYQLPVRTVQNWEQDRDGITGSALTLLILIDKEPEFVAEILARRG